MAGSRTHFSGVQTLHCLLPRAVEMFWLQLQHGIYGHRHGIVANVQIGPRQH